MDREERNAGESKYDLFRTKPIRYPVYKKQVFEPCLERIATGPPAYLKRNGRTARGHSGRRWRPTPRQQPTNLEIINALMPMIKRYGGLRKHHEIMRRAFAWLTANRRSVDSRNGKIVGWAADYVWEGGRIDVWMTAAALEFLVSYRRLIVDFVDSRIWIGVATRRARTNCGFSGAGW